MSNEKPIEVTVEWQRIVGEPSPLWVKLWGKLLAPREKKRTGMDINSNKGSINEQNKVPDNL